MELFASQPDIYRREILPPTMPIRVALEAGVDQPWWRWVGDRGAVIGVNRFGASAPYQTVYEKLGLTPAAVAERAKVLLGDSGGGQGG
jgi:transketolase